MGNRKAGQAFEDFTGSKPSRLYKSRLPDNDVSGWKMGKLEGVAYEATRDGITEKYFHEFAKSARPDLVSQDDGKQLYISGGRYKVTDRGVEDMPALFVVNPSKRPSKRRKSATMAAPRRRRRRATRQVAVFRANPSRRRTRRVKRRRASVAVFRSNPVRRRRRASVRRYRRNPSGRSGGLALNLGKMILPAVGIGAGAIGSELIMGYLPLPANLKTGAMRHVTKGAVSIAAGMIIAKGLKMKRLGHAFALGGVVIAAHDAIKELIVQRMPGVKFGAFMPYSSMGEYMPYSGAGLSGMGYVNPGQLLNSPGGMGEYVRTTPGGAFGAYHADDLSYATDRPEFGL